MLEGQDAGLSYVTGYGGAVTQATSKGTAVTLNKPCGQITMNGTALEANGAVQFRLINGNKEHLRWLVIRSRYHQLCRHQRG